MDARNYEQDREFDEARAAWEARRDEQAYFGELEERLAAETAPLPAPLRSTAEVQALLATALQNVSGLRLVRPRKIEHLGRR